MHILKHRMINFLGKNKMNKSELITRIETETAVNDFILNEVAVHGANNIFNSALSDDDDVELQEMAKAKIHDLEYAHPEAQDD